MKPTIITVSGLPGSGTSTISRQVADGLGYSRFSAGDFMRNLARERNESLIELLEAAKENPKIDRQIDAKVKNLADGEQLVVDSRLGFHFIPDSFAVYLDVDFDTAARRIYEDTGESRMHSGEGELSLSGIEEHIKKRVASERERYRVLYGVDHTNLNNYDLVVDTGEKGPEVVTQNVIEAYKDWQREGVQNTDPHQPSE